MARRRLRNARGHFVSTKARRRRRRNPSKLKGTRKSRLKAYKKAWKADKRPRRKLGKRWPRKAKKRTAAQKAFYASLLGKKRKSGKRKSTKRSRAAKKAARTRASNKAKRSAAAKKAARSRKRKGSGVAKRRKRKGGKRRAARRSKGRRRRGRRRARAVYVRRRRGKNKGKLRNLRRRVYGRTRRGGYRRLNPGSGRGLLGAVKSSLRSLARPATYMDAGQVILGLGAGLALPPILVRWVGRPQLNSGYYSILASAVSTALATAAATQVSAKLAGNVFAGGAIATLAKAAFAFAPGVTRQVLPLEQLAAASPVRAIPAGGGGARGVGDYMRLRGMGAMTADQLAAGESVFGMRGMGEYLQLPGPGAEFQPTGESF